jgi:hypothetical protein
LERKQRKEHLTKEGLIEIIQLAYTLNEHGKGKTRKRSLSEVIAIIQDKEAFFANPKD